MVKNLDKLNREDLFQLLSQKVDTDTAQKFWEHRMSGVKLIDLTSDELKEIVFLVGPRKDMQSIITDFKKNCSNAGKVQPMLIPVHSLLCDWK